MLTQMMLNFIGCPFRRNGLINKAMVQVQTRLWEGTQCSLYNTMWMYKGVFNENLAYKGYVRDVRFVPNVAMIDFNHISRTLKHLTITLKKMLVELPLFIIDLH